MSVRVMIQKFGSKLSNMVIPNLGAFIAWGLLTAVGIGINNEMLRGFVTPMLNRDCSDHWRYHRLQRDDVHRSYDSGTAFRMGAQEI